MDAQLDVRGTAQALDYEVQAYAFGPLDKRRLILRSDPPLPQDSLIQLLTTGMAPGVYAGHGSQRNASWRLGAPCVPLAGSSSRRASGSAPQRAVFRPTTHLQAGRATLRGRFELWRGLSLMNEIDGLRPLRRPGNFNLRLR